MIGVSKVFLRSRYHIIIVLRKSARRGGGWFVVPAVTSRCTLRGVIRPTCLVGMHGAYLLGEMVHTLSRKVSHESGLASSLFIYLFYSLQSNRDNNR